MQTCSMSLCVSHAHSHSQAQIRFAALISKLQDTQKKEIHYKELPSGTEYCLKRRGDGFSYISNCETSFACSGTGAPVILSVFVCFFFFFLYLYLSHPPFLLSSSNKCFIWQQLSRKVKDFIRNSKVYLEK